MKKQSNLSRLLQIAGNHKYLTYASWVLSAISALIALVPFYYIWKVMQEVLAVAPDFSHADAAFVLIAGGLGGVKQPEGAIRRGEKNRVLFGMGRIVAQALWCAPAGSAGHQHGSEDRNIRFSFQRAAEPRAQQSAVISQVQKACVVLDHRRRQKRFLPFF